MHIYAHRGYKKKFPENTMLAFQKALKYGADGIELDVQLSQDGEIIVIHDETLNRTTTGRGFVKDFTYKELKKLGSRSKYKRARIPALKEVLDFISTNHLLLNIEIKVETGGIMEQKLSELLKRYQLDDRIVISSFYPEALRHMKRYAPHIETALLYTRYLDQPWLLKEPFLFEAIHADTFYISQDFAQLIQREGLSVRIYTVNKARDISYWLASNIDAIITDDVEMAVALKNSLNRV